MDLCLHSSAINFSYEHYKMSDYNQLKVSCENNISWSCFTAAHLSKTRWYDGHDKFAKATQWKTKNHDKVDD